MFDKLKLKTLLFLIKLFAVPELEKFVASAKIEAEKNLAEAKKESLMENLPVWLRGLLLAVAGAAVTGLLALFEKGDFSQTSFLAVGTAAVVAALAYLKGLFEEKPSA